jgi:hypothetical protein
VLSLSNGDKLNKQGIFHTTHDGASTSLNSLLYVAGEGPKKGCV